jgi:hypothetical protein
MPRPEMPALKPGDELMMYSGTPGRRDGRSYSLVRVVTVGRKYVHVIWADRYDAYIAEPQNNRWYLRKFLIQDMTEGEPGKRIGYSARLATTAQAVYDTQVTEARDFLRDVAGIDIVRGIGHRYPFSDTDNLIELAKVVRELFDPPHPEIEATPTCGNSLGPLHGRCLLDAGHKGPC